MMKIKVLTGLLVLSSLSSLFGYVENRSIMSKPERIFWSALPVCFGSMLATQVSFGTNVRIGLVGGGAATSLLLYGLTHKNTPTAVYEYACISFDKIKYQEVSDYNVEQIMADLQVLKSLFEKLSGWESAEHFPVSCQKYCSDIQALLAKNKSTLQGVKLTRAVKKLEQLTNDPLLGNFGYSSLNFGSYTDQDSFICRQMAAAYSQNQYPLMTAEEHLQKVLKDLIFLKSEFLNFDTYEQTTYVHQLEYLMDIARQRIVIVQTHSLAVAERARFEENRLYQERIENERRLARQREVAERAQAREQEHLDKMQAERYSSEERAQQVLAEQIAIQKEIDRKNALEVCLEREREEENRRRKARNEVQAHQSAEERAQQVLAEQLVIQKELDRKREQEARDKRLALELQAQYNREEVARAEQIKREASRREKEERQANKRAEEECLQSEAAARRAVREAKVNKEIADRKERERKEAEIQKEQSKIKKKKDKKEKQQQAVADDVLDGLNDFLVMTETIGSTTMPENSVSNVHPKSEVVVVDSSAVVVAPECAICLETLAKNKVSVLDCNSKVKHAFHTECIKSLDKCPYCSKVKIEFMKNVTWEEVDAVMKTKGFSLPS